MADFLTRLAERTLGMAPVVQPLIVPEFASDPIFDPPDSGWDAEVRAEVRSSDNLTDALPADATPGRPEPTVIEPPGGLNDVVPANPETREVEDKSAPPSVARTSPSPKTRSAEDAPDRVSTRPAEIGEAIDPPTEPPSVTREPKKRVTGTPVVESQQDPNAPDESRSEEAATSAPDASTDPSSRSVVDVLQGEQVTPAPVARATRVETAGERRATRDIPKEGSDEVTRVLPRSRELPSPKTPSSATRATEIETVVPVGLARRPGRSDEGAALPSTPVAYSQDSPSHTSSQDAEPESRPDLPTGSIPDERESEPRDGVSPSASATPNKILVKPTMRPHAHPEDDQRQPSRPPEPIIRVNIGRVEVRATTPSLPRQQAAKPARLSLDDYLRSRNGGQR